jgi:hypothetical protein
VLSWVDQGIVHEVKSELLFDKQCSKEMKNPEGILARLDEQVSRGFMIHNGSEFNLTSIGKAQLFVAKGLGILLNLRNWADNTC